VSDRLIAITAGGSC